MAIPSIKLSPSANIPQVGLGTWLIKDGAECKQSIKTALEVGYRHFDTAQIYENEKFVGAALKESDISRDELFITTKIWNENMYWDDLVESFDKSLKDLQTDYVDLLLLHFPVTELRRPAWKRMEDVYNEGRARAIGVSNYTVNHLEELLQECKIKPAVNQVELHVFLQQPDLAEYCKSHDIAIEAYSPLAHGYNLTDPTIAEIAKKHGKTYGQVMLRWCLEQDWIVLPKAARFEHIKQNFDIFGFSLDNEDRSAIKTLDRDLRTCWDPTHVA